MSKTECQIDNIYSNSDNLIKWIRTSVNTKMNIYYNYLEGLLRDGEYKDCDYLSISLITLPPTPASLLVAKWWTFLIVVLRDAPGSRFMFFSDRDCGVLKYNLEFFCIGSKDLNMKCDPNLKRKLIGIKEKRVYTKFNWETAELGNICKIPRTKSQCNNCKSFEFKYKRCSKCKKTRYCSKACQASDWKNHKFVCT